MLQERIEGKWIETFASVFKLCRVESGTVVAILSETQSRPVETHERTLFGQLYGFGSFRL